MQGTTKRLAFALLIPILAAGCGSTTEQPTVTAEEPTVTAQEPTTEQPKSNVSSADRAASRRLLR